MSNDAANQRLLDDYLAAGAAIRKARKALVDAGLYRRSGPGREYSSNAAKQKAYRIRKKLREGGLDPNGGWPGLRFQLQSFRHERCEDITAELNRVVIESKVGVPRPRFVRVGLGFAECRKD